MGRLILHSGFWTFLWNIFPELSWVPLTTPCDGSGHIVICKPLFGVASLFLTLKCKSPFNNYLPQLLLGCEKDFIFSKQPEAFVPQEESKGALPWLHPNLDLKEGLVRTQNLLETSTNLYLCLVQRLGTGNFKVCVGKKMSAFFLSL